MSLFNYTLLDVNLSKPTRTLNIQLKQNKDGAPDFSMELLFELEGLLMWCMERIEIQSILLTAEGNHWGRGLTPDKLKNYGHEHLEKLARKMQKINFLILQLPQTVIADIGEGCENLLAEMAFSCDILLADKNSKIKFNHLEMGLSPSSGATSIISEALGMRWSKRLTMESHTFQCEELVHTGIISNFYTTNETKQKCTSQLLEKIALQSSTARIQCKLAHFLGSRERLEKLMETELKVLKGTLTSGDWAEEKTNQISSSHMRKAVKLSLVHGQEVSEEKH